MSDIANASTASRRKRTHRGPRIIVASWGKSDRLRRLWNARSLIASKAAAVGASTRNRAGGGRTRSCAESRIPLSASQFAPGSGSDGGNTLASFVVRLVRHPDMLAAMTAIGTSRCSQHFSARSNFPPTNRGALYSLFRARPGSGFQRIDKLGWFVFAFSLFRGWRATRQ